MITSVGDDDFKLLSEYIKRKCGIVIPPEKSYLIETRFSKILAELGLNSFGELYKYAVTEKDPSLAEKMVNAITTNETLWFRDKSPWEVLRRETLPFLEERILKGAKIRARIWCAAASTGQEAYSTAMCVDDYLRSKGSRVTPDRFEIVATDISSRVLDIAKMGKYDAVSIMRGLDDYCKTKYFTCSGTSWEIADNIKKMVKFSKINLCDDFSELGFFDVIFCRYVLIYFDEELKRNIAGRLCSSLNEGGALFTGIYASYELFKDKLEACHEGNLTYFMKKNSGQRSGNS